MGQYYRGVILGNSFKSRKKIVIKQVFNPYNHNNGAKLMEHSYVGNWYVKEYENSLANEYYNSHFVWVGDYAQPKFNTDVYSMADMWYDNEYEKKKCVVTNYDILTRKTYEYIINFTKKEFIRIPKEKRGEWIIHPLPLLCADGNGRGSGDYYGTNMKYVGYWAYDKIGVGNEVPDGFTELTITFEEIIK